KRFTPALAVPAAVFLTHDNRLQGGTCPPRFDNVDIGLGAVELAIPCAEEGVVRLFDARIERVLRRRADVRRRIAGGKCGQAQADQAEPNSTIQLNHRDLRSHEGLRGLNCDRGDPKPPLTTGPSTNSNADRLTKLWHPILRRVNKSGP